jgi:hypothetical protein
MSEEAKDDNKLEFDVMPGADIVEDEEAEALDLSFPEPEPEPEEEKEEEVAEETEEVVAEESEEVVAEEETAEESDEEVVSEDEGSVAEAVDEPEPEPEPETAKRPMVPKSRLDEVLQKQKALQKQLDDMISQQAPAEDAPEEYNFVAKEVEYQNAVLDGEADKAAAIRMEIRKAERAQIEYEMSQKMTETVSQNQQANALQQAATALEAEFPVFDSKSDQYNEALTQEVIDLRDAFMIKGENAVAALSKAAKFVISENNLVDTADPAPSLAADTAPKQNVDEVAKKRKEVARKLKAADAQPPELQGEGAATHGEKGLDLSNMTEEEFDALPEATLKRLRGDIL